MVRRVSFRLVVLALPLTVLLLALPARVSAAQAHPREAVEAAQCFVQAGGEWTQESFICMRYWALRADRGALSVLPTLCEACLAVSVDGDFAYAPTLERCRRACSIP